MWLPCRAPPLSRTDAVSSAHAFNDYSFRSYGKMINDERRTGPFVEALRQAIKPGSVVLDIGTGTGIFSFLACSFGAARVYAVEPDTAALELARRCAADVPGSERITWLEGLTTHIDLPERADVVVGDLHGTLPFFKGNIESLIDARKRHLKPGGRLIPSRDVLHAVPAHAPHEYEHIQKPWQSNAYGINLSAAVPLLVNTWGRARPEPALLEHLLARPERWGVVDYTSTDDPGLDGTLEWTIERGGVMHGLYAWFDGDLGEGLGYSNAPDLPELVYGRAFFPLEHPVEVVPGDIVQTRLAAHLVKGSYIYRWDTRVHAGNGAVKSRFEQSTFKARPASAVDMRKASPNYVPALNADGQTVKVVLEAMTGGQKLQEIAETLMSRFPLRFKTAAQALDEVVRLARKYG